MSLKLKMVVFHEWIPLQLQTFESQTDEIGSSYDRGGDGAAFFPLQTVYEIPQKRSMIEKIKEIAEDNEKCLAKSHEIDIKMKEVHEIIKNFDLTDFTQMKPLKSFEKINELKVKTAECESILSMDKRVMQLEVDEPLSEITIDPIKATDRAQKSSLTAKKSQFTSSSFNRQAQHVPKTSSLPIAEKPKITSLSKVQRIKIFRPPPPSPPCPSVQEILIRAKEKCKKSQTGFQIPVINLKFE